MSQSRSAHVRPAGSDGPVVITAAELPYDEQLRLRKRRYLIMMSMRVPLLIIAAAFYHTPWIALTVVALSVPLPWIAVVLANDRPARKTRRVVPGVINHERALPAGGQHVIDGD